MRWRNWLVAVVLIAGMFIVYKSILDKVTLPPSGNTISNTPAGELEGDTRFGQTFVSVAPGLHRIDVLLATYARPNTHNVVFHLKAGPDAVEDIYTEVFNASDVVDNAYRNFAFPAIQDSAGKTYFFYLESPESEPGDAITIWGNPDNPYPDGYGYLNDMATGGDLNFQAYYSPDLWHRVMLLLDQLRAGRSGVWGSRWPYASLLSGYAFLTAMLLYQIAIVTSSEKVS
jgi:hypothetical protein